MRRTTGSCWEWSRVMWDSSWDWKPSISAAVPALGKEGKSGQRITAGSSSPDRLRGLRTTSDLSLPIPWTAFHRRNPPQPSRSRRSVVRVARNPTEDPYAHQQRRPFVTERKDGAQVEDFQGWNHRHTPSSCSTVRAVACRLGVCVGRSTQTADTEHRPAF